MPQVSGATFLHVLTGGSSDFSQGIGALKIA